MRHVIPYRNSCHASRRPPASGSGVQPYKYNGKELDMMHGLNTYDYGARQYYSVVPMWDRMDPLCEKYYNVSPYVYCENDPVNTVDPDGRSTWVSQNQDGTYTVQGGALDGDKSVYLYSQDKDGNWTVRGACIGQTACVTSFYDSDKDAWAIGAVINPNDNSGQKFLDKMMSFETTLDDYMDKARNDHPYDFKVTNGEDEVVSKKMDYTYRGMPIQGLNGNSVYASARDVGNMAAGMVAAKNGIPWSAARIAFDTYQSIHDRCFSLEGISTQNAERYGWNLGVKQTSGLKAFVNISLTSASILKRLRFH